MVAPQSPLGGDGPLPSSSGRLNWTWRFEDAAGRPVSSSVATVAGFPSQSDAESWLGEVWRELLDDGVQQVTLFEGDREVYGPMPLTA